jgi:hypothetical protein
MSAPPRPSADADGDADRMDSARRSHDRLFATSMPAAQNAPLGAHMHALPSPRSHLSQVRARALAAVASA